MSYHPLQPADLIPKEAIEQQGRMPSLEEAMAERDAQDWDKPDAVPAGDVHSESSQHLDAAVGRMLSPEIPDDDSGYVQVDNSSDCRMLWWLYGAQRAARRDGAPLVLWLEGGPGSSGWLSDLGQIGPYDASRNERSGSWAGRANLLFVDSPVGAGFSFCGRNAGLRTSLRQVVIDLQTTFGAVLERHPRLRRCPLWIFGQGWGAQPAVRLAEALLTASQQEQQQLLRPTPQTPPGAAARSSSAPAATAAIYAPPRPRGVGLGNPWLLPEATVTTYGAFLRGHGVLDALEAEEVDTLGMQVRAAARGAQWARAAGLLLEQSALLRNRTGGTNLHHVLRSDAPGTDPRRPSWSAPLAAAAQSWVRKRLRRVPASVRWGDQAAAAFDALRSELMPPALRTVDALLSARVTVVLYSGALDVAVNPNAFELTLRALGWRGASQLASARKVRHASSAVGSRGSGGEGGERGAGGAGGVGTTLGFSKHVAPSLHVYWMLNAGHEALADSPEMGRQMLQETVLASAEEGSNRVDDIVQRLEEKQGVVAKANDDAMARLDEWRRDNGGGGGNSGDGGGGGGGGNGGGGVDMSQSEWMMQKVEAADSQSSNDLLAYEKRVMAGSASSDIKALEKSVMHSEAKEE